MLRAAGEDAIVVGHILVDKVTPLFGKKLYAVDVNMNEVAQEALASEHGEPKVLAVGAARMLPLQTRDRIVRSLSMFDAADRNILHQWSGAVTRRPSFPSRNDRRGVGQAVVQTPQTTS